jgi:RNA polymerase sigma-70 factor (sigma-E family)
VSRDGDFHEFALGQTPGLRRLAYALAGDWHQADDLVQGALERAYVHWSRVHAASDPGAYARTVLVNLATSESRRAWRRRERTTDTVPEPPSADGDGGRVEGRLDLARALSGLTAKQRAVMVLRFVEDRPVAEVAAILGIAPGTVKRQTSDAAARLRALMENPNGPGDDASPSGQSREVPHA